jgi:biotin synthase
MDIQTSLSRFTEGTPDQSFLAGLLALSPGEFQPFHAEADRVCRRTRGDGVYLRGIIEFSNCCSLNCAYCGIRSGNQDASRYRMSEEEILGTCATVVRNGIATVVLQSGEDPWWDDERLCGLVRRIKAETDLKVTLSVGERSRSSYAALRSAGADRYLLRIETTDKALFRTLHPDDDFNRRLACLKDLKELGYETGTGVMVGLPGQTLASLADDLLFFKSLDADMIGIGPFLPHSGTPLAKESPADFSLTLKMVSLIRLLIPDANIPATTAMGTADPAGREKALRCGANVLMPNCTPQAYRPHYALYENKICVFETAENCANCVEMIASAAEKRIVRGPGNRKEG